jgi:N-acetyl-D-muramate 6-phosphate phosphatase
MIRAVLFDLDGTLADTAPDMARTVNLMRTRRGLQPVALHKVRPFVSRGARGMICAAFDMTTEHPEYPPMRQEFLDLYVDNLCIDSRLFPGVDELLGRLESSSIAWGVVTNKFERLARPLLDTLGLGRAAVVVGGATCARATPFPDPLLFAARSLDVAPAEAVYVGDDERDIQAGRAAGMAVIAAAYGYLGDGAPVDAWGADVVVDSARAIGEWIAA